MYAVPNKETKPSNSKERGGDVKPPERLKELGWGVIPQYHPLYAIKNKADLMFNDFFVYIT